MAILTNTSGQYQIKPGDTLTKIAANTGKTIADLLRLNPQISNPNLIRAGTTINVGNSSSIINKISSGIQNYNLPTNPKVDTVGTQYVKNPQYGSSFAVAKPPAPVLGSSKPIYDRVTEQGLPYSSPYPAPVNKNNTWTNTGTNTGYSYDDLIGDNGGYAGGDTGDSWDSGYEEQAPQTKSSFSQALLDMLAKAQQTSQSGIAGVMKQSQDIKGVGLGEAAKNFANPLLTPTAGTTLGMSAQDTFNPALLSLENQQRLSAQNLSNVSDLLGKTGENYLAEQELMGTGTTSDAPSSYKEWTLAGSPGTYADWIGKGPTSKTSDYAEERVSRVLESVDSLLLDTNRNTTGWSAFFRRMLPETDARNYRDRLDTLKSNIAFNELVAMREASKTGGALGQVSDREGKLLESSLGALDQLQDTTQLTFELNKIKASLARWQAALNQYGTGAGTGSYSSSDNIFAEAW